MKPAATRLIAFGLILAGAFSTAYVAGERLPGHNHSASASGSGQSDGHDHSQPAEVVPPAPSVDGFQLVTLAGASEDGEQRFRIMDDEDQPVREFLPNHGTLIHAVMVRPDLSGFTHRHPAVDSDGTFGVTVPGPGQWHIVFDALPSGSDVPIALAMNTDDETVVDAVPLPDPDDDITVDGLRVVRSGTSFTVTNDDGTPAELEPYLGQAGHLVAFNADDLSYLHLHPTGEMAGMIMFAGDIPSGTWRVFVQFGHDGNVVTAPFTVNVP